MNKKVLKIVLFWVLAVGVALIATLPYLNVYSIGGDDVSAHSAVIMGLAKEIQAFHFPLGVLSNTKLGNGDATPMFYPLLFVTIPAAFTAMGIPVVISVKIFVFILNLATFLITFWVAKRIMKRDIGAIVTAIVYTLAVYRIGDIYFRFAIGEFIVLTFMPLFLYAMYNLFYEENKKIWLMPLSFFLIINSHLVTATFAFIIFILFFIVNIYKLNKKLIKTILISGGFTILVSLGAILPMLEQMHVQDLNVPQGWDLQFVTQQLNTIFSNKLDGWAIGWGIGYTFCILPIFLFCKHKNIERENRRFLNVIIIFSVLFLLMTTKLVGWAILGKMFDYMQFPTRLHTLFILFASFAIGFGLLNIGLYIKNIKLRNAFNIIILLAVIANGYLVVRSIDIRNYLYDPWLWQGENVLQSVAKGHLYFPCGDYLPNDYDMESVHTLAVNETTGQRYSVSLEKTKHIAQISEAGTINMPVIYYKGYSAKLITANGTVKLDVTKGDGARVQVDVPEPGELMLYYIGTPTLWVSRGLSYLSVLFLLFIWFRRRKYGEAIDHSAMLQ